MTDDAFLDNLTKKFPQLAKDPELDDIADLIKPYTDESRMRLWNEFRDTYTNVSRPTRAVFFTIASRLGIGGSGRARKYEYFCFPCEAFYPVEAPCCPKCKNRDRDGYVLVYAGQKPDRQKIDDRKRAFKPGAHPVFGRPGQKGPMSAKVQEALAKLSALVPAQQKELGADDEERPYWAR